MKKSLLLSAILFTGICVNAQSVDRPQSAQQVEEVLAKTSRQAKMLDEAVNLTTAQEEKAYAILLEKNKAIEATPANAEKINQEQIIKYQCFIKILNVPGMNAC